jgi:hypothetical protein
MAGKLLLAKVALAEPKLPKEPEIRQALGRIRADAGPLELTRAEEDSLVFQFEGQAAAISLLAEPIGSAEIQRAAAAAWYWPTAAKQLAPCGAQILVGVVPESGDRVQSALRLTNLASATAEAARAEGVFWTAAGLVHSPDALAAYARQMSRQDLPLYLWIDFHVHGEADGTSSLYTTGLAAFQSPEIEIYGSRREPRALVARVYDIVHYLLLKGAVLHEGDTIGRSGEEKIEIHLGPSRRDLAARVVQIAL